MPSSINKRGLVPKLRFPEFRDAEGWQQKPLGKLLMRSPDYGVNAAAVPFSERLPKYLRITDISDDGAYLNDKKVSVDIEPTDEIYLDEGDIVLARTGASVGKSYRYRKEDGKLVFAGFLIRVKPDKTKLVSGYLANFLTTRQYWDWVAVNSARSGQPGINSTEYSSLAIPLPPDNLGEQQKIAECLSSVDELIAAQARKLDALKTHKKGLMQQLFPREGETQPRLRFPEFQNAGEWAGQPLKEVFSIFQGFAFSSNDSVERGSRWLKIADVGIQLMNHDAPSFLPADYKERFAKFSVREGDYVIALTRPILSRQLKIAQVDNIFDGALLNQRVGKLITSHYPAFVFFLLQSWKLIGDIEKSISGNDPPNLSAQQIEGIKTYVPRLPEQLRIADCLTSLDDLIAAQTKKLEALKTHKKGLMQQLFPSPEEVEA